MSTTTRKRKPRAIAEQQSSSVTPEMKQLAAEFHRENTLANAAKGKADKARKALYKGMKDAGVKSFDLVTSIDGRDVSLEATVEAKESTAIDVAALRKIVTEEQFLQIISASKTSVESVAGKDVAIRVSRTVAGTENVSVKLKK